ncbi:MAG: hypothetical protein GC178_18260 [Flavobacteriales bacterium]|nr:hypothetical protein [Flavobacteriales bacterium]
MAQGSQKPVVVNYWENEWEFVYPSSVDNEETYNEFWAAVELLGYQDKKAETVFKRLIAKHPYYIDAYNHLSIAFRNQKKFFESSLTAEKSYDLGKDCFPQEFDFDNHRLIWQSLDNRPFLRACHNYGLECQHQKNYDTAIRVYNELLRLNGDDHQGIRYLLLEVFFAKEDFHEAESLLKKYPDDYSIEFTFGTVVLNVLQGNSKQADEKLSRAIKTNKHFINEVIKTKHVQPPPHRIPGEPYFDTGIPMGSVQQAYEHWERNKTLYSKKEVVAYFKSRK